GGGYAGSGGRLRLGRGRGGRESARDAPMHVAEQLVEAAEHLAHGLLLLLRQRLLGAEDLVEAWAARSALAGLAGDAPGVAAGAAHPLRALIDDLQGVVQIVQVAGQGVEDLLEGIERGLLLAGL